MNFVYMIIGFLFHAQSYKLSATWTNFPPHSHTLLYIHARKREFHSIEASLFRLAALKLSMSLHKDSTAWCLVNATRFHTYNTVLYDINNTDSVSSTNLV